MEIIVVLAVLIVTAVAVAAATVVRRRRRRRFQFVPLPRLHYFGAHDSGVKYDEIAFAQIVGNWHGRTARPPRHGDCAGGRGQSS